MKSCSRCGGALGVVDWFVVVEDGDNVDNEGDG
jgi:hypothetical protein